MDRIEKSIQVDVPIRTVYNQWTQFEDFPKFMDGVHEVKQLDDRHLLWRAVIGGKEEQWEAEISDQVPDQRIAWHSVTGAKNGGLVTFHAESPNQTRVTLRMDYEPKGVVENVGSNLGIVPRQVEHDLERFKDYIEHRGKPTGAWRGEIHGDRIEK
jgi:uncharacterized membrane protein